MEIDYPAVETPATPEYVLEVLRDWHRQQCQLDGEADPSIELSFASTVAEWRTACDLMACNPLGRALNQIWQIDCSDAEWRAVLHPPAQRSLAEVCQLIARHAKRPSIRPATLLGAPCLPAGAFLTLRCMLHRDGVDIRNLRPSTPLDRIPDHQLWILLLSTARLAPGTLPTVTCRHEPIDWDHFWSFCFGHGSMLLSKWLFSPWLIILGGLLILRDSFCGKQKPEKQGPKLDFGGIRTFRDLAMAIAAQA